MRGEDQRSEVFFSYIPVERRIPPDHPLRAVRMLTDEALAGLSRDFDKLYARDGRPSIPPERLLRALLLQAFYTVRSERQLMEQLDYNLLFRWFVGLSADDPVWDATVFCKNRDRLLDGGAEPAAGAQAALQRTLLGRWHADRGLGLDEELHTEGWRRSALGKGQWRAQRRTRLPWRKAHE